MDDKILEKKYKNPYRTGRPKKYAKWSVLNELIARRCTCEECAVTMGVSPDTIVRRIKETFGLTFAEYYRIKSQLGTASLRSTQFKLAEEGNVTMLIWLGKNWLGQTDKVDVAMSGSVEMVVNINPAFVPESLKKVGKNEN